MDRSLRGDTAGVLAEIGRHWGWVLTFGVVTVVAGLLVLIWPGHTLVAIAVLFGIQLVVAGIFRFVAALASDDESGATRVLLALLGVLSFIVGLYALRHILITIAALALLLGIFWIVNGAIEAFAALSHEGMVVLVYPSISLLTLAVVLGIWLLLFGVMEITLAFRIRAVGRAATHPAPAT
jgi:uncharacterized membrane protein HdeD (DUF308 family)